MKTIQIEIKTKKKSKIKDFIFNGTNGKSWYFLSQREKKSLLINEDDMRNFFPKSLKFLNFEDFIKIYIGTKTTCETFLKQKIIVF